jgi:hypothetical protein
MFNLKVVRQRVARGLDEDYNLRKGTLRNQRQRGCAQSSAML